MARNFVEIPDSFLNPVGMRVVLENWMQVQSAEIKRLFEKTVATWKNKPKFVVEQKRTADRYQSFIHTTDKIYFFVSGGTKVRYAIMSANFSPKTRYKTLNSYRGRGKVVHISKKHPMPGIKAREFPQAIDEKLGGKHVKELQKQIDKAIGK